MNNIETMKTDVLVVGSGGAGMRAAIAAADSGASVIMLSKGRAGVSGATVTAIADVSVDSRSAKELLGLPGDMRDSKERFIEDTIRGGAELNDVKLVERFVDEVPERVKELLLWGAKVRNFSVSPGHSFPRAVIINGRDFAMTLLSQVRRRSRIQMLDNTVALELAVKDGRAAGAYALDIAEGRYISISAKSVVLATGGAMNIFPVTTAPNDLLGDGISMALRAGAQLRDMEFQTFMLGCAAPPALLGNNYPYILVCRCGAHIYNREGERFLKKTDPERMEKTTRDKLAVAAAREILEGRGGPNGGVWVSIKHIPDDLFDYYKQWYESGLGYGAFDPKRYLPNLGANAVEAMPSAHFWCGGITIDENCRTGLEGLYAAGECTGGLHGANRLSGNAMAEIVTMGRIAGENAAHEPDAPDISPGGECFARAEALLRRGSGEDAVTLKKLLQTTAWETAGPVRSGEGLIRALDTVKEVRARALNTGLECRERRFNREWLDALSLDNMCDCLEAVAMSAYERDESLGSHFRLDIQSPGEERYTVRARRGAKGEGCKTYRMGTEGMRSE